MSGDFSVPPRVDPRKRVVTLPATAARGLHSLVSVQFGSCGLQKPDHEVDLKPATSWVPGVMTSTSTCRNRALTLVPFAALTPAPAVRFGAAARTGQLAVGFDADVVVLDGDPVQDVGGLG